MVTRQFPKEASETPAPPDSRTRYDALCVRCHRATSWPLGLYEKTDGTCARCLGDRPDLLMQLVAAEGGPYRRATLTPPAMRWGLRRPHRIVNAAWPWVTNAVVGLVAQTGRYALALALIPVLLAAAYLRRVPR